MTCTGVGIAGVFKWQINTPDPVMSAVIRLRGSMSKVESQTFTWTHSRRWLWCAKLLALTLSLLFAFPHLPITGEPEMNFITAMFGVSVVSLIPAMGWTTPCLAIGFWLSPILFAFRINGSFAEDLTAAIVGGMVGCLVGFALDYQKHQLKRRQKTVVDHNAN